MQEEQCANRGDFQTERGLFPGRARGHQRLPVCGEALREPVDQIVLAVRKALENTPPEIAADIIEAGIVMTGGGSLLPGIDAVLAEQTGLPVRIADDPMNCTAVGAGRTLEELAYRGVLHAA